MNDLGTVTAFNKQAQWAAPDRGYTDGLGARQDGFSAVMSRLGEVRAMRADQPTAQEQARETAQDFVAIALVQPVLKQLRDGNQAAAPFAPGPGEKAFRGFADAQLARDLVRGKNFPLIDRVAEAMLKQGGAPVNPRATELSHTRSEAI